MTAQLAKGRSLFKKYLILEENRLQQCASLLSILYHAMNCLSSGRTRIFGGLLLAVKIKCKKIVNVVDNCARYNV